MRGHFFDLDILLTTKSQPWIICKDNPSVPIMKIPPSDFNLFKSGIFKKQNNRIDFNGKTFWLSTDFWEKLKVKAKAHRVDVSNLAISLQEYLNKDLIDNIPFDLNMDVFRSIVNTNDDIYIICSKNTRRNYETQIEKFVEELKGKGLQIKNFYYISETFFNRNDDEIAYRKVRLVLQHLVGFKTSEDKFIGEPIPKYHEIYFYDNDSKTTELMKDINVVLHSLTEKTDETTNQQIKDVIKKDTCRLFVNFWTGNKINKFLTSQVDLKWSNIAKTFDGFKKKALSESKLIQESFTDDDIDNIFQDVYDDFPELDFHWEGRGRTDAIVSDKLPRLYRLLLSKDLYPSNPYDYPDNPIDVDSYIQKLRPYFKEIKQRLSDEGFKCQDNLDYDRKYKAQSAYNNRIAFYFQRRGSTPTAIIKEEMDTEFGRLKGLPTLKKITTIKHEIIDDIGYIFQDLVDNYLDLDFKIVATVQGFNVESKNLYVRQSRWDSDRTIHTKVRGILTKMKSSQFPDEIRDRLFDLGYECQGPEIFRDNDIWSVIFICKKHYKKIHESKKFNKTDIHDISIFQNTIDDFPELRFQLVTDHVYQGSITLASRILNYRGRAPKNNPTFKFERDYTRKLKPYVDEISDRMKEYGFITSYEVLRQPNKHMQGHYRFLISCKIPPIAPWKARDDSKDYIYKIVESKKTTKGELESITQDLMDDFPELEFILSTKPSLDNVWIYSKNIEGIENKKKFLDRINPYMEEIFNRVQELGYRVYRNNVQVQIVSKIPYKFRFMAHFKKPNKSDN